MARTTVSQQNSKDAIGQAGLNLADLRGLGLERTLVLQNGRRHVGSLPGLAVVDINSIPAPLIERIDIVTGGNSSIYGSDAVAGVVNFILKRNFQGIEARGQAGISSRNDRGTYTASLTAGQNFAGGRGNVAISAEYARAKMVEMADRAELVGAFTGYGDFMSVEFAGDDPGGSDGIIDNRFMRGLRIIQWDPNGIFHASMAGALSLAGCSPAFNQCLPNGFPRIFRFNPDGSLVEANYGNDNIRVASRGNAPFTQNGDTGDTRTSTGQLVPGVERYSVNLLGHFEVAEALKPYIEAKYVRVDYAGEVNQPFISQMGPHGSTSFVRNGQLGAGAIPIRFDNGFLQPAAAATIRSFLPPGTNSFRLARVNTEFGRLQERGSRETYRVVAGVEGKFNGDWHYDLSFNYGKFELNSIRTGERVLQRFVLATDAVRNPANGQIICRSQLPGQVTPPQSANPADAAALAADIAACVPVNLFGQGSPSQAAINYFNTTVPTKIRNTQKVVSGFISGDSSQLFELPGGPIGFAIGGEWRQEDAFEDFGDEARSGRISFASGPIFDPVEKFEVKEAFGELSVPILADRPFFHELTLNGAARIADYTGRTGTVLAWNAGAIWAPVPDLRLRANYAVSVRAPTISALFRPLVRSGAVLNDPCDLANIKSGSPTREANCRAAGVPVGYENKDKGAFLPIATGGNPLLTEETSKSWTIGGVFQPRFVPGLSLSADYYDIRIEDAIAAVNPANILTGCYDAPTFDNEFCAIVFRDPVTHGFSINPPFFGLISSTVNFASLVARGIDFEAAYRRGVDGLGQLNLRLNGTYVLERKNFPFASAPQTADELLLESGNPTFVANLNVDLKRGPITFGYQARYISKMVASQFFPIEAFRSVNGNPPFDADAIDPIFARPVTYHDIRMGIEVGKGFNFYLGVDNVLDKLPPFDRFGSNFDQGAAVYDTIGRYFYAGTVIKF